MRLTKNITLALIVLSIFSCKSKNITLENTAINNSSLFTLEDEQKIEIVFDIEYYKDEIEKDASTYYRFDNSSMSLNDLMNISSIKNINNLIPRQLTFLVCWLNQKGYVYWLYSFNNEHKITEHYYIGDFVAFKDYQKLMEKMPRNISEYGTLLVNDFNKDGKNEIAVYSFYKNLGNVFCVYGFNSIENTLEELCLTPVFINYDAPFPSVEYIENGFKILEITDENPTELFWINYTWNKETGKYTATENQ